MRIVAGRLGGRTFNSPHGHRTRPMSEKLRGALFNTLGDIQGLSVLDAFAGSGALAFEAISRGASHALAIESERHAQQAIIGNIKLLKLHNAKLIKANASAWLSTSDDLFDIVICDPPYDNLQPKLLISLTAKAKPGGLIVLSLPPGADVNMPTTLQLISSKDYGDATLSFYRA